MQREGGRPVAARRRLESSGFNKPFPQSENGNHNNDNRALHLINLATPSLPGLPSWIPAFAGMTAGVGMGVSPSR